MAELRSIIGGTVTLSDVAKHAGVGKSTASAVLRGASETLRISTATQERVQQSAVDLRYRPNAVARGLAQGRMNTLGVLFRKVDRAIVSNSYAAGILEGIMGAASDSGFNVTLFADPIYGPRAMAPFVNDRRTDGILVVAPTVNSPIVASLATERFPLITVSSRFEEHGVPSVDVDNELGTRLAVKHLIALGHKRIAHMMGALDQSDGIIRYEAFRKFLNSAGFPLPAEYIMPTDYWAVTGYEAARNVLTLPERPTAIFASNDSMAVVALEAARDLGISVPSELSVVGFDDIPAAMLATPQLTTIRQPLTEMGKLATNLLLSQIAGEEVYAKTYLLQPELVVRGSTGPPP